MGLNHATVKIANGASQSNIITLEGSSAIVVIHTPDSWTAANITFLAAESETGDFSPVVDADGNEMVVTTAADRAIVVAPDATRGFKHVKLRSGTNATPVNQGADREFTVAIAGGAAA